MARRRRDNPIKEMLQIKQLVSIMNKKLLKEKSPNLKGNPFGAYYDEEKRKWIVLCGCTWIFFNKKTRPLFNMNLKRKIDESIHKHVALFFMGEKGMEGFRDVKRGKDFKYRIKG